MVVASSTCNTFKNKLTRNSFKILVFPGTRNDYHLCGCRFLFCFVCLFVCFFLLFALCQSVRQRILYETYLIYSNKYTTSKLRIAGDSTRTHVSTDCTDCLNLHVEIKSDCVFLTSIFRSIFPLDVLWLF